MRLRYGVTCATVTCAGAAIAGFGITSCVSDDNAAPEVDASLDDVVQPDANVPSDDSGTDTGVDLDSGTDTSLPVDSGPGIDAADSAIGCAPSGSAFTPPPYVPAQAQAFDCNTSGTFDDASINSDLDDLFLARACVGDASTYQACSTFATTGEDGGVPTACATCLLTPESNDAGTYGPAVVGPITVPNLAGCIQLADVSDAGYSCAVAIQAAWKCAEAQCKPSCPVTDDPSRLAFAACAQAAATNGVCNSYTQAANACVAAEADAGVGTLNTFCLDPDPVTRFENIARFFCTS